MREIISKPDNLPVSWNNHVHKSVQAGRSVFANECSLAPKTEFLLLKFNHPVDQKKNLSLKYSIF
jgi:hypothetical protein